ncbi:transporter substrate-binding domain-containing protein [Guyparkeria sp.]|uniref:transporter substrate-binding domain-containing protein n=1 Tax=Guyparkeria sp. TaxID=2035736 RepID=UPI003970B092
MASTTVEANEVTVGLYENDPKIFGDSSGRPSGIFVELIERIAAEEEWDLSFEECAWADCLERTARGHIDLVPDVAISDECNARLDFHTLPAPHGWSQFYRRQDVDVDSASDLVGRRIAFLERSIQRV